MSPITRSAGVLDQPPEGRGNSLAALAGGDAILTSGGEASLPAVALLNASDPLSLRVGRGSSVAADAEQPGLRPRPEAIAPLPAATTPAAGGSAAATVDRDAIPAPYHLGTCLCSACSGAGRLGEGSTANASTLTGTTTAAPAAAASLQTLATYLTTGYWQQAGTYTRRYNLSSSGIGAKSGTLTYNVSGWAKDSNGLSPERQDLAREVFKGYAAVLGINLREVSGDSGDLRFTDNDTGAYAYAATGWYNDASQSSVTVDYSVVNVEAGWYGGLSGFNTYTPQTFFHEIGHALGLGHQGQYNYTGTPLTYASSAQFANDSWQATMMSYWDQLDNPTTGASFAWLQTPMTVDWIALNDLYGGQGFGSAKAFQGDTVYGVGTTISASQSRLWNEFSTWAGSTAYTLVDGSGYDTLDVSNFSANQLINLAPSQATATTPSISNIGGLLGNLTIAAGTLIEAASGGSGNDSFLGNDVANRFRGNGGDDSFWESAGSDVYYGDAGNDWLYFNESIDLLSYALSGDSLLFSRRSGGGDIEQVWNGLENLSFNGVAYTYNQLVASLPTAPQPTATLSLINAVGGSVNEGSTASIDIATANLSAGANVYWQLSGTGINTSDFVGLSSLTGSVAIDASGKAALNLGIRADATTEGNELMGLALFSDAGLTNKLADLSVTIQDTSLTPVITNLTLWGSTGSDVISGAAGNDRVTGVLATGTTATAMGAGQIDTLTGLAGADVFVLGDSRGVFYDDRVNGNQGASDYARITDFRSGEDLLQLRSGRYLTAVSSGDLSLYWDRNSTGQIELSGKNRDELIAVLQGVTSLSNSNVIFV